MCCKWRWLPDSQVPCIAFGSHAVAAAQFTFCVLMTHVSAIYFTAEDPSENFQRVRDFVDAKNCSALDEFRPENLHSSFSSAMSQAARKRFKINKVLKYCF